MQCSVLNTLTAPQIGSLKCKLCEMFVNLKKSSTVLNARLGCEVKAGVLVLNVCFTRLDGRDVNIFLYAYYVPSKIIL